MSDATGTYRIQLRPPKPGGERPNGFAAAAAQAGYLAALGVSHVYLSPVLQAAPGSTHGYDVVDHRMISAELGGEQGFRAMVQAFRSAGLKVIVDIVPNHMAVPHPVELNGPLAAVRRDGPASPYARWFDIDWSAGDGRVVLPGEGEPNYRRFFDISGLIGLRVEDPDVFAATHEVPFRLLAEGLIDGLRVDHPDGLADPRGYLRRLAERTGGAWVVVEKILTGAERLPADWPCAGTTGYDALGMVDGLFVDPAGTAPLTATYAALTGGPEDFAPVARAAKRHAAEHGLRPEVARLHRSLCRALPGHDSGALGRVLAELLVALPVYRTYVVPGEPPDETSMEILGRAADTARDRLPAADHPVVDAVAAVLAGGRHETADDVVVRFQQTSAALMAKGIEDTAFYRWSRLVARNEVGGEPDRLATSSAGFHEFCARLAADWPATLTALSTHDTKRQEDVRARLAVLAELPGEWAAAVPRWRKLAGTSPLEPDLDYLLWQTIVGAWPLDRERLVEFLGKAMREAKTRTSWEDPDADYEKAVAEHATEVLANADLLKDVTDFVGLLAPYARVNTLGQKLVQLTMPGIPDVYQGCELLGLALVDPDNRRPVDYGRRHARLNRLDAGGAPRDLDDEKLLVTSRALRLRRRRPDWFAAGYEPVIAAGPAAGHVVAFRRGDAITVATRLPVGLERGGGWRATALPAEGHARWRDVLTGRTHAGRELPPADVLARLPVALLVPADLSDVSEDHG
ncbi:MAG TPA: malto-oligosyltrehalose synthase [Streptosporangiaceae bacterium]|nr:malto-oligosyltrehalose synthase [Streptosporangiaceae bacterium]